jgi:hypothetical protein
MELEDMLREIYRKTTSMFSLICGSKKKIQPKYKIVIITGWQRYARGGCIKQVAFD